MSYIPSLHHLLKKDMESVDALILAHLDSQVPALSQIAHYLIKSGGKRVRPLLTLAGAHLCGYAGDKHIALAASVEFIHTATLFHDDVVDSSPQRRGRAAAHTLWGAKASILVGDFLFSRAFSFVMAQKNLAALDQLCRTACQLAEGEMWQLTLKGCLTLPQEQYIQTITAKTASLFRAACALGTTLLPSKIELCQSLENYGLYLGLAFQLMDDYLDYQARQDALGKPPQHDLEERKVTLPVLWAYAQGTPSEQCFWQALFESTHPITDHEKKEALLFIQNRGGLAKTRELAQTYSQKAQEALASCDDTPWRAGLIALAQAACDRQS